MRATPAELNQLIDKMRGELAKAPGSFERGKLIFDNQCAKCHKFDGRGHEVGPNIEGAGRDIEYLLTNVLDPNRVIGARTSCARSRRSTCAPRPASSPRKTQ